MLAAEARKVPGGDRHQAPGFASLAVEKTVIPGAREGRP